MFGIAVVPSVLLVLGMAIAPESPRWLFQVFLQLSGIFFRRRNKFTTSHHDFVKCLKWINSVQPNIHTIHLC